MGNTIVNHENLQESIVQAENGNNTKKHMLGMYYDEQENYEEAFNWFLSAANNNYIDSITYIGKYYFYGIFVEKNYAKSYYWFQLASEKNQRYAYMFLGMHYLDGYFVEKNYDTGYQYIKKAVELGCTEANICLGKCYEMGWGVEIDYAKAIDIYTNISINSCDNNKRIIHELAEKEINKLYEKYPETKQQYRELLGIVPIFK